MSPISFPALPSIGGSPLGSQYRAPPTDRNARRLLRSRTYAERRERQMRALSVNTVAAWVALFRAAHFCYKLHRRVVHRRAIHMRWYRLTLLSLPICNRFLTILRAGRRLAALRLLSSSPRPILRDVGYNADTRQFSFRDAHGHVSSIHPGCADGDIIPARAYAADGTHTQPMSPPLGSPVVLCPESRGAWCYRNTATGESSWLPPEGSSALVSRQLTAVSVLPTEPPPLLSSKTHLGDLRFTGWVVHYQDAISVVQFINEKTGHVRHGPWISLRAQGKIYFANLISRETRWLPPPLWMEGWISRRPCDGC